MLLKKGVSFVAVSVAVMFLWVAFSAAVVECPAREMVSALKERCNVRQWRTRGVHQPGHGPG